MLFKKGIKSHHRFCSINELLPLTPVRASLQRCRSPPPPSHPPDLCLSILCLRWSYITAADAGSDAMGLLRLGPKKSCSFYLSLLNMHSGKAMARGMGLTSVRLPCCEEAQAVYMGRDAWPTISSSSQPSADARQVRKQVVSDVQPFQLSDASISSCSLTATP